MFFAAALKEFRRRTTAMCVPMIAVVCGPRENATRGVSGAKSLHAKYNYVLVDGGVAGAEVTVLRFAMVRML
jgi:hypothetical protein